MIISNITYVVLVVVLTSLLFVSLTAVILKTMTIEFVHIFKENNVQAELFLLFPAYCFQVVTLLFQK